MIQFMLCVATLWTADTVLSRVAELGPVRVTTTLTPQTPTIGDEIVLAIKVEAAAGVDVLMPEFGEALSRYTIIDYVPRQHVADDGSTVYIQRYTLQPYLSGDQSIPPILIEFVDNRPGQKPAPDDLDAYEILTERLDFKVESVLPKNAAVELNPPLGELALPKSTSPARNWSIAAALGGIVVLGALALVWYSRRRRGQRRNAYEIARARLDHLLIHSTPRDAAAIEAFFVEISAIIRRYLEDRFDLRAPELTTEEFLAVAGTSGALSRAHQGLLREFLRRADLVKFAGLQATDQDIRLSSDLAIQFLEETRENAPLIEVPSTTSANTTSANTATGDESVASARSHQSPHALASARPDVNQPEDEDV